MKRFLGLCVVCFAVVAVSFSHNVRAGGGNGGKTVTLCHVVLSDTLSSGIMRFCGKVITVSENAEDGHLAHGDVELENATQIGSRCAFSVLRDGTVVPGLID